MPTISGFKGPIVIDASNNNQDWDIQKSVVTFVSGASAPAGGWQIKSITIHDQSQVTNGGVGALRLVDNQSTVHLDGVSTMSDKLDGQSYLNIMSVGGTFQVHGKIDGQSHFIIQNCSGEVEFLDKIDGQSSVVIWGAVKISGPLLSGASQVHVSSNTEVVFKQVSTDSKIVYDLGPIQH